MGKITNPKELTLYWHAHTAFRQALSMAELMVGLGLHDRDPRSAMLFGSLCGYYGRPFKKSRDLGRLHDGIIPLLYKPYHEHMLHMRDKIFLHTDSDAEVSDGRKVNELKFHTDDNGKLDTVESKITIPDNKTFNQMVRLIKVVSALVQAEINSYLAVIKLDVELEPCSVYSLKISDDEVTLEKEEISEITSEWG